MRAGFAGGEPGFGCLGEAGVTASNALDTGLALEVSDMTIAWWHRVGQAGAGTANAFAYVLGGPGDSQRIFVGGSAGTGRIRYAGTGIGNVDNLTDFKNGFADVWTHLALVVDDQSGTATWYLNGVPDGSIAFAPGMHQVAREEFWVGFHSGTQNYSLFYSMDDFRLYSRALSGVEIAALANSTEPGVGLVYGAGCPASNAVVPQIGGAGGAPAIGNVLFEVTLDDADPNALAALVFGALANSQTPTGGMLPQPLTPFGVGFPAGCNLELGGIITSVIVLQSTGNASLSFPIPPVPAFAGTHFRAQWGVLGSQFSVSPALDIGLR